ncbi:hypothetical protein [Flavobacterium phage V157]|uniref:Acb2/Tad1 hairpin domain-containing protein n=2 Tax=Ficleduovirus FCV1 TaxID=2560474 RepID=A0A218M8R5_9CAUD|nr:hypothetical protein [Flavobacterium phage V156]ASD52847.1 hypothetical protein [Flavobacterium phage V157]ASD53232.1 hypothetical protein [Flavobacterium phage VK48]ASD53381.1 hypothetical protein [Flavobacterium phage VK58]
MYLTIGEKRVKAELNPSKNELVDQIKNKSAELINLLEQMRGLPHESSQEKQRLISIAQTEIESACMWGVKANFTE